MVRIIEENEEAFRQGLRALLLYIGEKPGRPGLVDTPDRVLKAWSEMTRGYDMDPDYILSKNFELDDDPENSMFGSYDQMIISKNIPLLSNCEHHMMPFVGKAHVGYIPNGEGRVVGLSKLARVVEAYALRLQVQERLTQQIADAVLRAIKPLGVMVVIEATHTCQAHRGVRKDGQMVTSALHGVFRDNDNLARREFLELIHRG